jgi:hypothetical protein
MRAVVNMGSDENNWVLFVILLVAAAYHEHG